MNLTKALGSVGGLTLASRVLALVRDTLQATYVGAGFASDAFFVAFRLPNMFRALFAEGAFSAAFIPLFNRKVAEGGGTPAGIDFAERALAVLFPVLLGFTVLMLAAAYPITWGLSGGFDRQHPSPEQFAFAVTLSRFTIPYLMLISLVSLLGGILNSLNRFWVNAAAPILLNLCLIGGLLFFRGHSDVETARTQAIAVTLSGALQLAWLVLACWQVGVRLRIRLPRLSPEVRKLLALIGPAAIGAGAVQFNLLISTTLAARFLPEGSVSYLYYADRLNQLPLGLIGIGVGTAMLPSLSRQLGGGDHGAALDTQNRAIELVLLLTLPATAALMVSATPLIRALLQHGAFTPHDTIASARALAAFSLGLPAYVLIKVLTPGFYARADTKTPVRIALLAMLVNLALNLVLIWPLAHVGLALSTAISAWVNAILLYWTLHRREHFAIDARLRRTGIRLIAATLAMAALLLVLNPWIDPWTGRSLIERVAALGVMIAAAVTVYFGLVFTLGAYSLATLRGQFRRKR